MLPAIERARANGVVLVGATNFLDQLDEAAIREGRFDYKILVPMPDLAARIGILQTDAGEYARRRGRTCEGVWALGGIFDCADDRHR